MKSLIRRGAGQGRQAASSFEDKPKVVDIREAGIRHPGVVQPPYPVSRMKFFGKNRSTAFYEEYLTPKYQFCNEII
jgi:hypothetical protein